MVEEIKFYGEGSKRAARNSEGILSTETAKGLIMHLNGKPLELLKIFSEEQLVSLPEAAKKMGVTEKGMKSYLGTITKTLNKVTDNPNAWFYYWNGSKRVWMIAHETTIRLRKAFKSLGK